MRGKGSNLRAGTQGFGAASLKSGRSYQRIAPDRQGGLLEVVEQLQAELACSRRTEEVLRESETRYRSLIESAQDVIFALAADGTITSLNAAFEQITGWPRAEWIGRSYAGLLHPEDLPRAAWLLRRLRRGPVPAPFELRIRTRPGEAIIAEFKVSRENRPPHLILGIARDITERKKSDEERTRLAAAVEAAAEAVVITDERGYIRYLNPAFELMTGYTRDEAIGKTVHLLESGKQDEAFFRGLRETLRRDGVWRGRLIQKKKDGAVYYEDCACWPVKNPGGRITNYVSVRRDVTDWLRLESIAESVNTMENIGYVFSGIRHEIGNPLNSAKMALSALRHKQCDFTADKVNDYLDRALSELGRMEYLLNSLRNYNLYEIPEIRSVEITEFLARFRSLVSEDFRLRNIALTIDAGTGPVHATADIRALQQALLNILTNAADALAGREDPVISVCVRKGEGRVHITVEDNGCGMTEEQQARLFKPFCTSKPHGTGLGLVLVKKMLTRMNGDVAITSRPGRGTMVDLFVPACEQAPQRMTFTA